MIFGGQKKDILTLVLFLILLEENFFELPFPQQSANDRIGFAQREPLVLQSRPIVSVYHWVVELSTLWGLPFLASQSSGLLTCGPACEMIPRRWPLLTRCLEIVSRNLAAPCSANTALCPQSSQTLAALGFVSLECLRWMRKEQIFRSSSVGRPFTHLYPSGSLILKI